MIQLKVITPEGVHFEESVQGLVAPTVEGEIGIYQDHEPIVALLTTGILQIERSEGELVEILVAKGVVRVERDSQISVITELAEKPDQIDVEQAEQAKEAAQKYLSSVEVDEDDVQFAKLQSMIEREIARINFGHAYRNRSSTPTPRSEE